MSAPALARPRLLRRPVSDAQREAARRNGRRSRGPATERGKFHSSSNARTHGLYAKVHVLSAEDLARFQEKKRGYLVSCSPHSPGEQALLTRLAFVATRLESLVATETALWNDALHRLPPGPHHLAQAFESIAESRLLATLSRLENHYSSESARLARDIGRKRTLELVDSTVNQPTSTETRRTFQMFSVSD